MRRPPKNRTCEFPRIRLKPLQRLPKEPGHPRNPCDDLHDTHRPPRSHSDEWRRPPTGSPTFSLARLHYPGSTRSRVTRDPAEVSTPGRDLTSRWNPPLGTYPAHYQPAFAFSAILYPHPQQRSLRSACPQGREYGLTAFRIPITGELGSITSPVARCRCTPKTQRSSRLLTFWFRPWRFAVAASACLPSRGLSMIRMR